MSFSEVYLVRHGEADGNGGLVANGTEQARRAGEELRALGLGHSTLLLSSNLTRALESGIIIGSALGALIVPSLRVNQGGNRPEGVESLSDWLDKAIAEARQTDCVVVTHQPIIHTALHGSRDIPESGEFGHGEVLKLSVADFQNTRYNPIIAERIEESIQIAGL